MHFGKYFHNLISSQRLVTKFSVDLVNFKCVEQRPLFNSKVASLCSPSVFVQETFIYTPEQKIISRKGKILLVPSLIVQLSFVNLTLELLYFSKIAIDL